MQPTFYSFHLMEIFMFCFQLARICSYRIHEFHGGFLGFKHQSFKFTVNPGSIHLLNGKKKNQPKTKQKNQTKLQWLLKVKKKKKKKSSHRSNDLSNTLKQSVDSDSTNPTKERRKRHLKALRKSRSRTAPLRAVQKTESLDSKWYL